MALRLASIFLSEDSPAEEQALPATERASTIQRLLCGGRWPDAFASFDPDSSCWRTSRISLLSSEGELGERFSGTWPRSIMCSQQTVFPLPPLAPRTSAIGSSLLLPSPIKRDGSNRGTQRGAGSTARGGGASLMQVLPTPTSHDRTHTPRPVDHGRQLANEIALLPTPTASTGGDGERPDGVRKLLEPELRRLLPTPNASLQNYEEDTEQFLARREKLKERHRNGNGIGLPLGVATRLGEPTPEPSPDGKKSPAPLLNPCFVEWMLGLPEGWSDPDCPLSATEFKSRLASSSAEACSPSKRKAA